MIQSPTRLDKRNGRVATAPSFRDKTNAQIDYVFTGLSTPELPKRYPLLTQYNTSSTSCYYDCESYRRLVRQMRLDPTLAFFRELTIAPIVTAEWGIGSTPEAPAGAVELIEKHVLSFRHMLLEHACAQTTDWGWVVLEKVFSRLDDGTIVVDKIKPLIEEITTVLVERGTGEYIGIVQRHNVTIGSDRNQYEVRLVDGYPVTGSAFLKQANSLLYNINVTGTDWYGWPLLAASVGPFTGWKKVNEAADRYDTKIAGSHFVVHYPFGTGTYNGEEDVDNFIIAEALLRGIEAAGGIAVPRHVDESIHELNKDTPDAWKIELLSDSSNQQSNFIDRLKYYDNLKARSLFFPERAVLEGSFGTKAEADSHADFAITILEKRHERFTDMTTAQFVNHLMLLNYGKEAVGTVYLKASPIADDKKVFLRSVFLEMLRSEPMAILANLDLTELRERLGVPMKDLTSEMDLNELQTMQVAQAQSAAARSPDRDRERPSDNSESRAEESNTRDSERAET